MWIQLISDLKRKQASISVNDFCPHCQDCDSIEKKQACISPGFQEHQNS